MRLSTNFRSVFFDLDGTLADTAPDLAAAANQMRIDRHLHPIDPQILRPLASAGARGLIEVSFGIKPDDDSFADLRDEFLNNYQAAIHVHTRLFDDIENLLNLLDQANIPWGIVTNKQKRFTNPLMQSMGLDQRTRAIVSGDTTPFAKPHPAPILLAAKILEIDPKHSLYVGDDLRDIVAGKAAGMQTVAAAYGYCGNHEPPDSWGADHLAYHPTDLIDIIFPKNRLE